MQKIIVTTIGTQTDDCGEVSSIELVSAGNYYEKNDIKCITYRESEISGMEGTTTLIKVYNDHFKVIRMGAVEQKQEFRLGPPTFCKYITPYGSLDLSITTSRLDIAVDNGWGSITADYELRINGQWQSLNTLSITIREEGAHEY